MMNFSNILISSYIFCFTIAVCYLYLYAIVGLIWNKGYKRSEKIHKFLILVPAHNECDNIGNTIESLQKLKQSEHSKIQIIADNCTDNTADEAKSYGVDVLIRFNEKDRGKGYALEYALSRIDLALFDAVLIVDADTVVDDNALIALTESFENGYDAAQLNNCLLVKEDTTYSQLQHIANCSENNLFYKPRAILRLSILLRGTGMAVTSDTIQQVPWKSFSVTEDVDYAANLLIKNYKIDYIAYCSVFSPATSSYKQSYTQKMRWASGTFAMIKSKFVKILFAGIKQKRLKLIELAFSLLLLSRPFMIYALLPVIPLIFILPVTDKLQFIIYTAALITLIILYIISGIFFVENKAKAVKGILQIPVFAFWFLKVQLNALFKSDHSEWKRTQRK